MLLLKQKRDAYWNKGPYSIRVLIRTGALIGKTDSGGTLIREGVLIGRRALNRIIMVDFIKDGAKRGKNRPYHFSVE